MRTYIRKKISKIYIHKLLTFYSYYCYNKLWFYNKLYYNNIIMPTLPSRQLYCNIYDYRSNTRSFYNVGRLIPHTNLTVKFYKRTVSSNTGLIVHIQKMYEDSIKYIYCYFIKNFNQRQWLFFKKFDSLINPQILYFIHKKSYQPRFLRIRRIKRSVLRLINK